MFKRVMGIIKANNQQNNEQQGKLQLSKSELEFLLILIRDSSFVGSQIETVYNLVLKLQEQYKTQ